MPRPSDAASIRGSGGQRVSNSAIPIVTCPLVSFVVEWDNIRYYEVARARLMLRRLATQAGALAVEAEILLLFDRLEIDPRVVDSVVEELRLGLPSRLVITPVGTQGLRYYQLKNAGARMAQGEIVVFVDSDVLPEEGWLENLLRPLREPSVQLVVGNSYIQADGVYGKAFALGWYFPMRSADGPVVTARSLLANNVAVRRELFVRYPFPEDPDLYIRQSVIYGETLRAAGIPIHVNPCARVAHPPPRFLRSALIQGHDTAVRARRASNGDRGRPRRALRRFVRNLRTGSARIVARRREVGLSPIAVPVALAIVGAYYALWGVAEALAHVNPRLIRRWYAI